MEDANDVISESSTEELDVEDQMMASLDVEEESSASSDQTDSGDAGADADNVEAKPEEGEAENNEPEVVPKDAFLRRVNGLQAAKRRAEQQTAGLQDKLAEYDEAFQIMKERLDEAEGKLRQWDEPDPRDVEIQRLKSSQRQQQIQARLHHEAATRRQEQAFQQQVDGRADQIIDEAHSLAKEFPTVTAEELVLKLRTASTNVGLRELAEGMNAKRMTHYKKVLAKQHGTTRAPAPVGTQGAAAPLDGHSSDDMVRFLESMGE